MYTKLAVKNTYGQRRDPQVTPAAASSYFPGLRHLGFFQRQIRTASPSIHLSPLAADQ